MYSPQIVVDGMAYRVKSHPPVLSRRKWELQRRCGKQWQREAVTTKPADATWQEVASFFGLS